MGMPARSIRRIFFAQGIVIGVVGTTTGLLLGLVASIALDRYKLIALDPSVYFIDHLPVDTQPSDVALDRKSTRLNSSHANISYAVFCLKKKQKVHTQWQAYSDARRQH